MSGDGQQPLGTLEAASGTVGATRADGTHASLQAGDPVFQGNGIATVLDAPVSIVFADVGVLSLGSGSRIVLEKSEQGGDSKPPMTVSVLDGVFVFVPRTIAGSEPGAMVLAIPGATIGIRGTAVAGVVDPLTGHARIGLLPSHDVDGEARSGSVTIATHRGVWESVTGTGVEIIVSGDELAILPLSPLDASLLFHPAYTETLAESGIDTSYVSIEGFLTEAGINSGETVAGDDGVSPPLFVSEPIAPMELVVAPIVPRRGPIAVALNETTAQVIDHSPLEVFGFSDFLSIDFDLPGLDPANLDPTTERIFTTTNEDHPTAPMSALMLSRDADGGTLSVSHIMGQPAPAGARITLFSGAIVEHGSNGMFVYHPNGRFDSLSQGFNSRQETTDWFTFTISDGQGGAATSVAIITILGVNDAPVARPDVAAGSENQVVIADVLANDTDVDQGDHPATFVLRDVAVSRIEDIAVPEAGRTSKVLVENNKAVFLPGNDFNSLSLGETATVMIDYTMSDAFGARSSSTLTIAVHGLNDAPIANNDKAASTTQNDTLAPIFILANDEDVDRNDTIRIDYIDTAATRGTITHCGDGTVSYDPGSAFRFLAAGETASDTFRYRIADQHGALSGYATVSITIVGLNDAPIAHPDFASVNENAPIRVDVLANDTDIDNGDSPATFTLETVAITAISGLPDSRTEFPASIVIAGHQLRFNPGTQFQPLGLGETATVTAAYTMADAAGEASSSTLTLTVHGLNDAPIADDDLFETDERSVLRIDSHSLLSNDSDPDRNDTIHLLSVDSSATKGIVTDNGDGSFTYSAGQAFAFLAPGAFATDTIAYSIVDSHGSISAPATIRILVRGVNDPPVARSETAYAIEKGSDVVIDVLANDSDPDSDDNRATLKIVDAVAASGAEVVITSAPGARILYKPSTTHAFDGLAPGASATDTITYTIEDSHGARASATVTVILSGVNDAPVAADDSVVTAVDAAVLIDVLHGDRDVDGSLDPATVVIGLLPQHGTVSIDPASGFATYTPARGFVGIDSFTYMVRDNLGLVSEPATVNITIKPVIATPVGVDDAVIADQGTAVRIPVLANDQDPAGGALTVAFINGTPVSIGSVITLSSGATIRFNEDQTLTYDPETSFGDLRPQQFAIDRFAYQVADANGTASEAAAVRVRVTGSARPELVPGEELIQSFEAPVEGWFADWTRTAKVGVLAADQMPIRVVTHYSAEEQIIRPSHPLSAQGSRMALIHAMPYAGDDAVQFNTIAKLEAALHLPAGGIQADVGTAPHNGSARAIWTDVYLKPGDTFSFDWTFVSAEDTPARNDFAAMTVSGPGTAAVFKLASVTDVLALSGTASGTLGMVTSAFTNTGEGGLFRIGFGVFNHLDSARGSVLLVDDVRINEPGLGTDPADRLTVLAANGPFLSVAEQPLAGRDSGETLETAPLAIPLSALLANDAGPSLGGAIRITSVNGIATGTGGTGAAGQTILPSGALLQVSALGIVTYDPYGAFHSLAQNETATDTFTYTLAASNGARDQGIVSITVIGVNDAPIAADDTDVVGLLLSNQKANIQAASLLANDRDPDESDFLRITAVGPTVQTKGTVTLHSDGSVSYDPNGRFDDLGPDEYANDWFAYTISDPSGATATAMVTVMIAGANDPPVARDDAFTTTEDAVVQGNVLHDNGTGADLDPDSNDTLSVSAFDGVSALGAHVTVRPDGTFTYDPRATAKIQALGPGKIGNDFFRYTIEDGHGGTDSATVSITIHGLNDTLIASNDVFATDEDAILSVAKGVFLSNDIDPDASDSLSFGTIDTNATRGTVTISGDTVIYDPRGAFNTLQVGETAVDSFTYTVRDSLGAESRATAFITIHGQGTPWTVADFEENTIVGRAPFSWDTAGRVRAVTSYPDSNESLFKRHQIEVPEGTWMARLDADPWPVANLREFLGIAESSKNHLMADRIDNSRASDGGAMKQTIDVQAGDIVSFRWAFDALDYVDGGLQGANDFALFVANGAAFRIMDVRNQMALSNTPFGAVEGLAFYKAPAGGRLTIGFGVFDDGFDVETGLATDSVLLIDHIQVNRETATDGYTIVGALSNDHFQTYAALPTSGT